jgi:hypothetical protein
MLSNYAASMFHCCGCDHIKSNLTIHLDYDNILHPHIMTSFMSLPNRYRWYDSRPARQAFKVSNKQAIIQWQIDMFHKCLFAIAYHTGSIVTVYFEYCDLVLQVDLLTTFNFPF